MPKAAGSGRLLPPCESSTIRLWGLMEKDKRKSFSTKPVTTVVVFVRCFLWVQSDQMYLVNWLTEGSKIKVLGIKTVDASQCLGTSLSWNLSSDKNDCSCLSSCPYDLQNPSGYRYGALKPGGFYSTDPRCTSIFYGLQRGDENMSKSPSDSIIVILAI